MIPVSVDISGVAAEFQFTQRQIDELRRTIVVSLTSAMYEQWGVTAGKRLNSSRNQYQRGLVVVDEGRYKGSVMLTGTVPNMIETGASAFDMKYGFSKSNKVKRGKNGQWYMTVPFRLATPGAGGYSEVFAGVVPTSIYQIIQDKPVTTKPSGVKSTAGLKFNEIPKEFNAPKVRAATTIGGKKFKKYKNKTAPYVGATKIVGSGGKGQVFGFRRVSANSDPGSWIHTGIKARKLADIALKDLQIDKRVDRIIDNFLTNAG